jgi:hypothetical protein
MILVRSGSATILVRRRREASKEYKQRFSAISYRTVHFLSTIYTECIPLFYVDDYWYVCTKPTNFQTHCSLFLKR